MQRRTKLAAATLATVLFVSMAGFSIYALSQSPKPKYATTVTPGASVVKEPATPPTVSKLLALVNKERAKVGAAPLKIDKRLNKSAQRKASDMAKFNYFNHISPADGKHGYEYINDTSIYCKTDGENLVNNIDPITGKEYDNTSAGSVAAWLASPSHRTAMLSKKYTVTGFGISDTYVVEHLCQQ